MKTPLVSIIIPVYNRAEMLKKALESVKKQTFVDFECIVVDDGSSDDPGSVVESINDIRFRIIRHSINKMMSEAYNTGFKEARGKYIALLESDDTWRPDKLKRQVQVLEDSDGVEVVYCGMEVKDLTGRVLRVRVPKFKGDVFGYVMQKSVIASLSTLMFDRLLISRVGYFDPEFGPAASYEYELRLARVADFGFVKSVEVDYLEHGDNLSKYLDYNLSAQIFQHEKLLDRYEEKFKQYPDGYQVKLSSLGMDYLAAGKTGHARRVFWKSCKFNPWVLNNWRNLILSLTKLGHFLVVSKRKNI